MSKDRKQMQAYRYLHGLTNSISINLIKGWNRHNFDLGRSRKNRKLKNEKAIDKLAKDELNA